MITVKRIKYYLLIFLKDNKLYKSKIYYYEFMVKVVEQIVGGVYNNLLQRVGDTA